MKNSSTTLSNHPISWSTMMSLLGFRLLAISIFLVLLAFVFKQDGVAFYAFIGFAYIITIPYSLWMRDQNRMKEMAPLQFLIDIIMVSGLVYFTGQIGHNFIILLYPLIILSAGIILPLRQTIQITALAIIAYTLVILLMSQNILTAYPIHGETKEISQTTGGTLLRICIFLAFGIVSAYVSRRCNYANKKEKQFREITKVMFKNVKTGLLLLDENNTILIANSRACDLLGRDEENLIRQPLSVILHEELESDLIKPELRGASHYFRRTDGTIFPISIEAAPLTLPAEAVPHSFSSTDGQVDVRILNFSDLSPVLLLQGQNRQIERVKAAANMAKEMAHQIRTPLTAISGFIQLLQFHNKLPESESSTQASDELMQQVVDESARLDKVIQNFLDYTEFSTQDIRDLVKMNIEQEMCNDQ